MARIKERGAQTGRATAAFSAAALAAGAANVAVHATGGVVEVSAPPQNTAVGFALTVLVALWAIGGYTPDWGCELHSASIFPAVVTCSVRALFADVVSALAVVDTKVICIALARAAAVRTHEMARVIGGLVSLDAGSRGA